MGLTPTDQIGTIWASRNNNDVNVVKHIKLSKISPQ